MVLRSPALIAYVLAAVVAGAVSVVTWRQRSHHPNVAVALTVVSAGACWWSVGDAVVISSTDETVDAIARLVLFPGGSVMVAAFCGLALCMARPHRVPGRWFVIALLAEPAAMALAAATNPWLLLLYRGPGAGRLTESAGWTYGPAFWVDVWTCYLELAVVLGLFARLWWKASRAFRGQPAALFGAALVPLAANAVFLGGGFGDIEDPTPIAFTVTGALTAYAILRHQLFTFSPVARDMIIDQIPDAVVVISPDGRVLDLNPAASRLLRGMNPDAPGELVGAPARKLVGADVATIGRHSDVVVELSGARAEFEVRASVLVDRGRRSLGSVLVARDVTQTNAQNRRLAAAHSQLVAQVEMIEQLRADLVEQASRDPLTGLHNRRHLVERFTSMVAAAKGTGSPLAVVLLDVDKFKAINDERGHLAGDAVLVALGRLLSERTPPDALVARWGGEEFFIALPGVDAATGFAFAQDVRRRCSRARIDVGAGEAVACTVSGGVAAYPGSGATVNELFHSADLSLYAAKNAGRNRVRLDAGRVPAPAGESNPG